MSESLQVDNLQVSTIAREKVEDLCRLNGEPNWLKEKRLSAWESYLQCPMPTVKDEDWRATLVGKLDLGKLCPAAPLKEGKTASTPDLLKAALKDLAKPGAVYVEDYARGQMSVSVEAELSTAKVVVSPFAQAVESHKDVLEKLFAEKRGIQDKFTLMNEALAGGGLFVHVPKNTRVEAPVVMMLNLPEKATTAAKDPSGLAVFPRVIINVEENASINFVSIVASEKTAEATETVLAASVVEFHIAAGAKVSVAEVTNLGPEVFFVNRVRAYVARDAVIDFSTAGLGGKQTKSDIETILMDRGAHAAVKGVVFGGGAERYAYNTIAEHAAPDTTSNINFRVALKDKSASIYQGIVKVDKVAQRTDAYQSNKNLLLGKEAKADSIPKLEILADDVKCSHGATVSPVDKEQLFYLTCRGLTAPEAEELIVTGFFQQVLDTIPIQGVVNFLAALTSDKLHKS
ncbi:MAG TPA: Fe-S cluster assembly protein SufD [Candidatus Obscuribacter sp.]|nr:Fe-S cluster assembly protein SufD [Candidatus Obscuribacter sp.]HNG72849.1 Fe-S cluster assembly protein SufD [Candidatus Obscuribacter sp.]